MRIRLVAVLILMLFARPVFADTAPPDDISTPAAIVTIAGSVLMVANTVYLARDGSVYAGAAGMALGTLQIVFGLEIDNDNPNSEFKAFTITTGTLGVIIGTASLVRGIKSKHNESARGVELTPGIDLANRAVGVQLIARW